MTTSPESEMSDEAQEPTSEKEIRKIILIMGSNRTGTSLLTEILVKQGFGIPDDERAEYVDYDTYESKTFKELSRQWDQRRAIQFASRIPPGKWVLKYPKASRVAKRWLRVIPDACVIYVYRPRDESVESNLKYSWGRKPFRFFARWYYRREWTRGLLAMSNLNVPVAFVSFDELKKNPHFKIPTSFGWCESNQSTSCK